MNKFDTKRKTPLGIARQNSARQLSINTNLIGLNETAYAPVNKGYGDDAHVQMREKTAQQEM